MMIWQREFQEPDTTVLGEEVRGIVRTPLASVVYHPRDGFYYWRVVSTDANGRERTQRDAIDAVERSMWPGYAKLPEDDPNDVGIGGA